MAKIVFDFDGVLVRSRRMNNTFLWSEHLEKDLGISSKVYGQIFDPVEWHSILTGKSKIESHLTVQFKKHGLRVSSDDFIRYWLERDFNWRTDVLDLAKELAARGHKLFIATNQDRLRGDHIKKQEVIRRSFSNVFVSADFGIAKPDRSFFSAVKAALSDDSVEKIILIDDDQRNIESAQNAGWSGIYFNPDLDPLCTVEDLRSKLL